MLRATPFLLKLLAALLLVLTGGVVVAQDADATPEIPEARVAEPYRVGAFFSLTGPLASLGQPQANTVAMIERQVNGLGGILGPDGQRHPLEVVVYDDESSPQVAVELVQRLITEDEVSLLIGGSSSAASLAVIDTVTAAEIPYISVAASSQIILTDDGEQQRWVFKATQQSRPAFELLLTWLQAQGIERVASLGVESDFGADSMAALSAVLESAGIDLVYEGRFPAGVTDFADLLAAVAEADPQALVVHATTVDAAALTVAFDAANFDMPLIQTPGVGNQTFITLAGAAANGVLVPIGKLLVASQLPQGDPQRAALLAYRDQYMTAFDEPVSTFGGHAWDALYMAMFALQSAGPDAPALREYLETGVHEWVGITGIYTLTPDDHSGLGENALVLVEIVDGEWRYLPPDAYAEP